MQLLTNFAFSPQIYFYLYSCLSGEFSAFK